MDDFRCDAITGHSKECLERQRINMLNNTTEATLLPCPFCGGEATIIEQSYALPNGTPDINYYITCTIRECQIRTLSWYPKTAAINSWNRRCGDVKV